MKFQKVLLVSALALATSGVQAYGYGGWYGYGNNVSADGSADSSASTYGNTSTHGTESATANSGAWNQSNAGATAEFSNTKSKFGSITIGTDVTKVVTKLDGEATDGGSSSTHYDTQNYYGTEVTHDATNSSFVDNSKYQGINIFKSATLFGGYSLTDSASKSVGVTTQASTVGGSFGQTTGYNANTSANYGGAASSWGHFNLNAYSH
ncbi:MAG: hypothetical protein IMF12_03165 [Proteobacteria bacterium]|nr:hypothetical protein [Pseudomonadota bacterium]